MEMEAENVEKEAEEKIEAPEEPSFLKKLLNEEEYASLSETIVTKIETYVQESFDEFLTKKALFETSRLQHEDEVKKLQEECNEKQKSIDEVLIRLESAHSNIKELEEKLENVQNDLATALERNKQMQYEWKDFKTQRDLAVDERESLLQMVERRNTELSNLKGDLSDLTKQLQAAVKAKMVALENAEEIESLKISLQYKEKRLEQESELLKAQLQSLNEEYNRQTTELLNLKKHTASRAVTVEAELAEKSQELIIAQEAIADLKDTNEKLISNLEGLREKLIEQRNSSDQMFDNFQHELQAQTKLTNLYKGLCEENDAKTDKLTNAINELQRLLKEASEQYGDLETKHKETILKHEEDIAKKNECLQLLRKELNDANELLQAVKEENLESAMATLSPCAAAASRLIKSGMTLTQIYTQYATISEQLLLQQEENRRLQLYVTTIVNEIEEKAPILRQQRLDYEKALTTVESLTKQMDEMIAESKVLNHECSEAKKITGHLTRENERLKKELADLSRQVCYLIKAVEEARGAFVTDLDGSQISYDENESSAQHIISKKLVTFGSIQDLQENNQKLLALVRQLSAKQEEAEKVSATEFHNLKAKEQKLQAQVNELMDDMDRQTKMLDLIKNQSLTYKKLYEQALGGEMPKTLQSERTTPVKTPPSMVTSTPKVSLSGSEDSNRVQELNKKLLEAENKFKKLEEEIEKYKGEYYKLEKKSNDQIQSMRKELNELIYKNSKLVAQAEYAEEKSKVLETNLKSLKKQIQGLEERNQMLSSLNAKHEQSMVHLKDEAMDAQSRLSKAEVALDNLRQENFLLKTAEARLLKEKESWNRERHSHSLLMSNLDAIKATFERSEEEGKLRLEVQLSEAMKECSALRNSLKDEKNRFNELAASLQRQTNTAKERMEEEKKLADRAKEDLEIVKSELNSKIKIIDELNNKIRELNNQPAKSVIESVTLNLDASTKQIKDLEKKVADLEHDVSCLQIQLTAAKQNSAQYSEMSENLEKQLNEANEEHQMFRELMTEKINDAAKREAEMRKKYEELEQLYQAASKSQKNSAEEFNAKLADSNNELQSASSELSTLKQQLHESVEEVKKYQQEMAELQRSLQEVELKYSNEVVAHSGDIQALAAAKKELSEAVAELDKLKQEKDDTVEALKSKVSAWEEQEKKSLEEVKQLNERLADLDEQNRLLHENIQELGNQVAILQSKVADEGHTPVEESASLNESTELSTKTQDQLLKVIKFIRQEKDVAITKSEILQSENLRLKTQLQLTTRELEELKEIMKNEKESSESNLKASARHAELLRKIDTLNAVTDSNRMLREERDKFKEEVASLKESLAKAESALVPLTEEKEKLNEKIETLTTENQALLMDVARWKQKANALAERSNKGTPEDWKRLTNERENLAKQWQLEKNNNEKLEEDLRKLKQEKNSMNEQLVQTQKNLQNESIEVKRLTEESIAFKTQLTKCTEELNSVKMHLTKANEETTRLTKAVQANEATIRDLQEKETNLKRIAKKYKGLYDDLVKKNKEEQAAREEEEKRRAEEEAARPPPLNEEEKEKLREEGRQEVRNELIPKLSEVESKLNEKIKELEAKMTTSQEESENLKKDNETLKTSMNEKEERAKQVMKTARLKIAQLTEQKNNLEKELNQIRGHSEVSRDESDIKFSTLKAQYESIITEMEKERSDRAVERDQEKERMQNEIKSLSLRVNQLQRSLEKQQSKPSTSSRPADKSTMEPPTANIKPMAGASSTAGKQKQTTGPVGPCWRSSGNETPFASIRPTISIQTRTLAVLPTSQTSTSQTSSSQSTPVMILPQQQTVHTTGNSGEALSSSPTSSHTDYMPATSSATPIRQVVVAPPLSVGPPMGSDAQSTQEMEAEANDNEMQQQSSSSTQQSQSMVQQQQTQTVAIVLPREQQTTTTTTTTQGNQQQSIDQSCGVAYSQANSSNTVTTTQAGLKRQRDVEGDSSTGLEGQSLNTGQQIKRTRVSVSGNQAEAFHHQVTHSEGIEVEYQVPTSSQRDQEDDMIIMVDSEEEGNADEGEVEEPDDEQEFEEEDNGEGYVIGSYSGDGQDMGMANYDEGPDIDEENVPDQDNNEVEVIDDSNEVPNQSGSSRDGVADNGNATQSSSNAAVPVASSIESGTQDQTLRQSSEATSSGPVNNEGGSNIIVVSHAASSQPSQTFRARNVPPLSRQQQSQLILPQSYEESGDDSIVPSTPTLFIPRRADGFGEAVSSPQIPHQARFTFSDPLPPISRSGITPVSGEGLEDANQLEEPGTGRSVPTTPLQVSPQEIPGADLIEVGQSSSHIEGEPGEIALNIPDITVTVVEDDGNLEVPAPELSESAGEDEEENNDKGDTSGDEPEIINLDEDNDNDGVTSEGEKPPSAVGEIEEGREAEASEPFDPANMRRPTGRIGGTARRSGRIGFTRRGTPRRPTPIVWTEPGSSSGQGQVGQAMPSVLRQNIPTVRIMTPDQQRLSRNNRLMRPRRWR